MPGLAGQPAGELERVGVADRVDRRVGAATLGQRLDRRPRVLLGQVHGLGAELAGQLEPLGDGVDRHHAAGALGERRLHSAEADRPEPEDGDHRARLHAALDHGVIAGAHHVAGEQGDVVRHPLRHAAQGEVRVRDQEQLGLGALERAERLAVAEDAAGVALVEVAAPAEEALAAGGAVGAKDPVADSPPGRPRRRRR